MSIAKLKKQMLYGDNKLDNIPTYISANTKKIINELKDISDSSDDEVKLWEPSEDDNTTFRTLNDEEYEFNKKTKLGGENNRRLYRWIYSRVDSIAEEQCEKDELLLAKE